MMSASREIMSDLTAAILGLPPGRAGDLHHMNVPLRLRHCAGPLECQLIVMIIVITIVMMIVMMITDLITVLPGLYEHVLTRVGPAQCRRCWPIRGRDKLSL